MKTAILDCYTDEPSGLGVPPYVGTYVRYLSQALEKLGHSQSYLTIDDLRHANDDKSRNFVNPKSVVNLTRNAGKARELLDSAETIYVVMGCFISYDYFSCVPPEEDEIYELLKGARGKIVVFYELGIRKSLPRAFYSGKLASLADEVVLGNPYRYVLSGVADNYVPDYGLLGTVARLPCKILEQLERPYIIEIETASGCNHGKCSFCIEAHRKTPILFRDTDDIILEVSSLYASGARHFRLGKQPNLFNFQNKNPDELDRLLEGIRAACPKLKTLHIDNVNAEDLVTPGGTRMVKSLVRYGTSGNITNFGVESFDPAVRAKNRLNGTNDDVLRAIEIVNSLGATRGEDGMPMLLPGINLLYGLPAQTAQTREWNLRHLLAVRGAGHLMRRIYFRKMTNPFGASFGLIGKAKDSGYEMQAVEIARTIVLPIQQLVYPLGHVVRGLEEIVHLGNDTHIRKIGTCPERFVVKNTLLAPGKPYDIRIVSHDAPRLMTAELVPSIP